MIAVGEAWGGIVSLPASQLSPDVSPYMPGDNVQKFYRRHPLFRAPFFNVLKLRLLALKYQRLKTVFIGDQKNTLMRHFSNLVDTEEVVALDDGTATIKYAKERCCDQDDMPNRWQKRFGRVLKRFLFGLRDSPLDKLTFFSVYPVALPKKDQLVLNDYSYLRKNISGLEMTSEVFFLGGPLVEAGVLSEEQYLWHLFEAQSRLGKQQVRYVRHRREDPNRARRICQKLGWESTLFDLPIEYQLALNGPRPAMLTSFYSSALENCRLIFGDMLQIISFRLSFTQMSCMGTPKGDGVEMVYTHYEKNQNSSFQVIRL